MPAYTDEKCIQIVMALMKAHGIRKVIVSPGSTNHTFVLSLQSDPYFQLYSCVDERSAAYMACGLAVESGEAVALSCTAATASRNYLPALTEAYYRKIPVLAITSTRTVCQVGNLVDQQIDRSAQPRDVVLKSVNLPFVKDEEDAWDCRRKANEAMLELSRRGGGPVHINMPTRYSHDFSCAQLPNMRAIRRITPGDVFPSIPDGLKVGINIACHRPFREEVVELIDDFCQVYDAVVFCDHTSNYTGKYGIHWCRSAYQRNASYAPYRPDLVIDIGEIGALGRMRGTITWRVSEDGELRDPHKDLECVFEMTVEDFFAKYIELANRLKGCAYFERCSEYDGLVRSVEVDLPFSNIWVASILSSALPEGSVLHLGILSSLRSWLLFDLPEGVRCYANTGGYGIDGGVSTLVGASLAGRHRLYYGVFGDLCFFYDMNVLGNRHIGNNIRILLVNNGLGEEFKLFISRSYDAGEGNDPYVAADGHFGRKSRMLVKSYAESLGFRYLCARSKAEFMGCYEEFVSPEDTVGPLLLEVFTDDESENEALHRMLHAYRTPEGAAKQVVRQTARKVLGAKGTRFVKGVMGKA